MATSNVSMATETSNSAESTDYIGLINWDEQCALCRGKGQDLQCPANSTRKDVGAGYTFIAERISKFREKELTLPFDISHLNDGSGIENTLSKNKAKYHKACRDKISKKAIS